VSRFGAPPVWTKGEPITAAKLNEGNARAVQDIRVGNGLKQTRNGGQVSILVNPTTFKSQIVRATVTTLPEDETPEVAGLTPWNGSGHTSPEVYCKIKGSHNLGDDILICQPYGGTDQSDPNGHAVTWEEICCPVQYGYIVCRGPDGEYDYTDSRYWVQKAVIANAGGSADAKMLFAPSGDIITATNLFEYDCDSHNVRANTPVVIEGGFDQSTPPVWLWSFRVADDSACYPACLPPSSSSSSSSSSEACCECYQFTSTGAHITKLNRVGPETEQTWISDDDLSLLQGDGLGSWLLRLYVNGTVGTFRATGPCPPTDASAWGEGITAVSCCGSSSSSSASSSSQSQSSSSGSGSGCGTPFNGTKTVVTGFDPDTCTVTTEDLVFCNGILQA
jgi:hypothetical protein